MNFDIEWNLQEFREEQKELFDENGKRYTGVSLSDRTAEIMLKLIDDMENEIERLEEIKKKQNKTLQSTALKPNVSSSKRIYISGKITGLDITEATKKFKNAEHYLMTNYDNIEIVNPMREVPYKKEKTWEQYMLEDINLLFGCDSIFMLDNWKNSKGARIEYNIAKEMSKTILFQSMFANEYY